MEISVCFLFPGFAFHDTALVTQLMGPIYRRRVPSVPTRFEAVVWELVPAPDRVLIGHVFDQYSHVVLRRVTN